ncbi:MAG: alpha/beta fold hydrolase [Salinirussus sp.]
MSANDTNQTDPPWLDRDEYPFTHRYLDVGPGEMHYVDEGEGRPLLMLHGNPTWSFLYRHLIDGLSDDYRCIAPDYLGFGLSDKPVGWSYRPADHAETIATLIDTLELEDFTLIANDWGGPIGLDYATRQPAVLHSLVLLNTFMWPTEDVKARLFSAALGNRLTRVLIRRYNLFATRVMPMLFGEDAAMSQEIHRHYIAHLATPSDREGSWVFPREITRSESWLSDLWERRSALTDRPMLLVWGTADPGLGSALGRWRETFPDAAVKEYPAVGHYVQEELGPELVGPVRDFLADHS